MAPSTITGLGGGQQTLAVDATGAGTTTAINATSTSWSHTVGANANLLVVVIIQSAFAAVVATTSVKLGSTDLTRVTNNQNPGACAVEIWTLASPTTGAGTINVVMPTNTSYWIGGSISFNNAQVTTLADYATMPAASADTTSGAASPATLAVTTPVDNCYIVSGFAQLTVVAFATTVTPTETQIVKSDGNGAQASGGASCFGPKTPAGSKTMTWTYTNALAQGWALSNIVIAPKLNLGTITGVQSITF